MVNLTATPYRADDKEITGKLVYRYSFKRAMVKGYIKRLQAVYVAPSELTFTYEGDTKTRRKRFLTRRQYLVFSGSAIFG